MNGVRVGIQKYEISQGLNEGVFILHLAFDNPSGKCEAYADFLKEFEEFLGMNGYSFQT